MVAPLQDWGLIDKSNDTALRNDIPRVRGGRKEFKLLNSTLDTMLEMKAAATEKQIPVPGLSKLIEIYLQTVAQGTHLREQGWWKRFRKLRDWHGSGDEFKERCQTVWHLAHQTSFMVHAHADKSETTPRGSIRRRRSLNGPVQAELDLDLIQPHNPHGDTPKRSTAPSARLAAQSSTTNIIINTNTVTFPEETVRHIAEMTAAKTWEQFILHGRLPIPQTINNFNGCIVRPGGGATHTVNFGGSNNRGAAVNLCPSPTEVEGNGADEIDGTSDDELLHGTAVGAAGSVSERHSSSVIAQNNITIMTSMQSPTPETHPGS